MNRIEIEADRADVLTALSEVLSAEELRAIKIIGRDSANPLNRTPRRAEPVTAVTILTFVGTVVLEGMAYDAMKLIAVKAYEHLRKKFGEANVRKDGTGSVEKDESEQ